MFTDDGPPESVTYHRIDVPTWIKRSRLYEESWMIHDEKSEPVCYGRKDWGWTHRTLQTRMDTSHD
jgi:hypothetical protein